MALTKRIIPCLDVKDGQTVKGIKFEQLRTIGDPVDLGCYYSEQGADELVFLDITATNEKRKTFAELVKKIARNISIPFTVGGGISAIEDVYALLSAGADKVGVNTAAVRNPQLIADLVKEFGSQCIVLAMDAKAYGNTWRIHTNGGKVPTDINAIEWAILGADMGAGEILLTSIDHDGTKNGFAITLTKTISASVNIPVIASGGAGTMAHFTDVFKDGMADAALAASMFHNKEIEIPQLKTYLHTQDISVRI